MRVAALYDIHANLPTLEAVLEDIRGADRSPTGARPQARVLQKISSKSFTD